MEVNETIDGLKHKEIVNLRKFEDSNPEINLPVNINDVIEYVDFSPLNINTISPLREGKDSGEPSWVQILSKDKEQTNLNMIKNDRCIPEF